MSEDLNTKSLGEKLCEAITPVMKCWPALTDASRSGYEQAALHFAASLSHDETANAVIADLRQRLQAAEERAEKVEAENDQLKLTASWAKSFGTAHDMMQDALKAISYHADNQDIGHIDYRMHAKQQADHVLEACAGSPGLLDPATTPKPDWTDGQWKWADDPTAPISERQIEHEGE